MTRVPQRAFAGGIFSPGMFQRRDIPKANTAVKDAVNCLIRAQGGLINRAGTTLAGGFDNSTVDGHQYLVPFEASQDDTYQLEFGDGVMRVIKAGAYVIDSSVIASTVVGITSANPAQIEMVNATAANRFAINGLVYLTDPNGDSVFHQTVLRITGRTSQFLDFEIYDGTTVDTTTGDWGTIGGSADLEQVYETTSPFAIEDLPTMQWAQDIDTMFFAAHGYDPQQLVRVADDDWTFSTAVLEPSATAPTVGGDSGESATNFTQANPATFDVAAVSGTPVEGDTIGFQNVGGMTEHNGFIGIAGPLTGAGTITIEIQDLDGNDVDSTGYTAYTTGGNVYYGLFAFADVGSGTEDYEYKVSAVINGEESLPSAAVSVQNDLTVAGNKNIIAWTPVAGATFYRIYKSFNGVFGYIGVSQGRTFTDENITPDTADNPQTARDPFTGANDKPRVASFVEQRLTLAATINEPQVVEMSQSVSPFNFNRALTPGLSDAVSFRMRSQQLNRVLHIIDADKPIILTAGAEWYIQTAENGPIGPGTFSLRPKTYRGSAETPRPVVVGQTVLHVTRTGDTIREFNLDVARDHASADVTLLARSLFEGKTIVSMAYAQSPDSVVWVVFSDGSVVSMTYLQEHEIWGWTRHEFGGTDVAVKQVSVVTEGAFDTPYFVIERTINGQTVTLVERLDTRQFTDVNGAYFVDGGLKYSGASTTELRGYLHMRNEDVSVLADGNVVPGITVTNEGRIVLPEAITQASIGYGYDSYFVTLPGDLGQIEGLGTTIGRYTSASEVALQVVDTRGLAVGREGGTLEEYKQFTGDEPIPLETGVQLFDFEGDWERDQTLEVRQVYPLPFHVTAVAPVWELGE